MTPRFGDRVVNTCASEDDPTKRGLFVRRFNRHGRLNPGVWWEVTDGQGRFWNADPKVCVVERGDE